MVLLDDLVEELVELVVSVVRSSVNADARVLVSNTGENTHFEGDALFAFLILILFPNFFGQALLTQ